MNVSSGSDVGNDYREVETEYHNNQTDFKLDGSHEGLECEACHKQPVEEEINLSARCNACHSRPQDK